MTARASPWLNLHVSDNEETRVIARASPWLNLQVSNNDEDGEHGAGARLSALLELMGLNNVLVRPALTAALPAEPQHSTLVHCPALHPLVLGHARAGSTPRQYPPNQKPRFT